MKKIEDYLHLYLGCECEREYDRRRVKLTPILLELAYIEKWKPLLRPLSDITEEEHKKAFDVFNCAETTRYLLSIGIDLFGLIEAGLAIDKTTLK